MATRASEEYQRQLGRSYELLGTFAVAHGYPTPDRLGFDPVLANRLLVAFVQDQFDRDRPSNIAKHAILAMQTRHRQLRGALRESWDAWESWELEKDSATRVPIDPLALEACCAVARLLGLTFVILNWPALGWDWLVAGSLWEVAFYGLLRPVEVTALRPELIRLPSAGEAVQPWAFLAIERPKNRRALGRVQFAAVRHQPASAWLGWIVAEVGAGRPRWPSGYRRLASMFQSVVRLVGLGDLKLSLAGLRAGGASFYYRCGVEPGRLKFLGRWASEQSVAHYIQECTATFVFRQLHHAVRAELSRFRSMCAFSRFPPALPWAVWREVLELSTHGQPQDELRRSLGQVVGENFRISRPRRKAALAQDKAARASGVPRAASLPAIGGGGQRGGSPRSATRSASCRPAAGLLAAGAVSMPCTRTGCPATTAAPAAAGWVILEGLG